MALGVGSCVHSSLDSQDLTELEVSGSRKFLLAVASPSSPPPAMPRVSLAGWSASVVIYHLLSLRQTFPSGASGKELICKCRRHKRCGFYPWIGKIPWRREWLPTPVLNPLDRGVWQAIGLQRVTHELKRLSMHGRMSLRQVIRKPEDSR